MRKPRDCCAQLSTYARPFVSPLLIPHPWSGPEMCVSSTNGTTWDCGDSAIVQLEESVYVLERGPTVCACICGQTIQLVTRLDVCVSSLRRGHTGCHSILTLRTSKWKDSSSRTMRTLRAIRSTLRSTIREGAALHANRNTSRSVRVILAQGPCEADCHNRVEI